MNGLGSPRLLTIVIIVAGGLIACSPRDEPAPRPAPQAMPAPAQATTPPAPAAPAAPAPAPALQGVVTGAGAAAVAVLAEPGKAPLLVPEGGLYSSEFRVEQVQPDHVVLRRQSDGTLITLVPGATPAAPGEAPAEPTLVTPIGELPLQPPVPAAMDASGPPPGPGLTGPALPGPVSGR